MIMLLYFGGSVSLWCVKDAEFIQKGKYWLDVFPLSMVWF
jgi:hypothetical protein